MSDPNPPRILVARLFHETHGFLPTTTQFSSFTRRRGSELLSVRGDGSTLDGFLEFSERAGWKVIPSVDYVAYPSGPVDDDVFRAFWQILESDLNHFRGQIDAIFLILHGAMATKELDDVEGVLLERIRASNSYESIPIFGVYDLHATFTRRMALNANGLLAYRENPHTDARNAAIRAANLLETSLRTGVFPSMIQKHSEIIWPPGGTATAREPMSTLEKLARQFESERDDIWALNVNAGFAFSDSPDTGVTFSAIFSGPQEPAEEALNYIAAKAFEMREQGLPEEQDVRAVLAGIAAINEKPVIVVETADNIGAGAGGHSLEVLKALIDVDASAAGIVINAPNTVSQLGSSAPGEHVTIVLDDPYPTDAVSQVRIEGEILSRSDGRFTLTDPGSHLASMVGVHIDMGPCVVVRYRGVTILLTSNATPPFDLGQWTSQGIDPTKFRIIVVKAAVGHRRAYDPIASANFEVQTRGPCPSDPRTLPYTKMKSLRYPVG